MMMKADTPRRIVGIIPAAGMGRRLFPYPNAKELFPIGYQEIEIDGHLEKRPKVISQYLVESMIAGGARQLYFVLGYGKDDIMSYYGSGQAFGVNIAYLFQDELLGMPYAIDLASPWLRGDETIIMGMPDTVIEPKNVYHRLVDFHWAEQSDLTLGLFRTANPSKFGMVSLDEHYNVLEQVDKPAQTSLQWLWGIACWGPRFVELLHSTVSNATPREHEMVLGNIFDAALARGFRVKGLPFEDGSYIDIGTYNDLKFALERYA
jgi:glucose-1-phosphate thymidylyltransferase